METKSPGGAAQVLYGQRAENRVAPTGLIGIKSRDSALGLTPQANGNTAPPGLGKTLARNFLGLARDHSISPLRGSNHK